MIAAFVKGEFDSARFGPSYKALLEQMGRDRTIVDHPNLDDADENRARHAILQRFRGYPNRVLFRGFPERVRWHSLELRNDEVGRLWYANWPTWVKLSGGTRIVADGAANIERVDVFERGSKVNDSIRALADRARNGETFGELILVAQRLTGPFVVLEGHSRATAYSMSSPDVVPTVRAIAAVANRMDNWWLFEDRTTR